MTWHTGPLALFDLESTGVDPHRDRIVSAAIIKVDPVPGARSTVTPRTWLLNPGIDIPEGAAAIHGITTEQAQASGAEAGPAVHEIADHLRTLSAAGYVIVGHNVSFDLTMLLAETIRHECPDWITACIQNIAPVADTMVLDKKLDPYRKGSRRLVDVCRHYGIELSEADAHGAEADALAAGRLAWAICARHGYGADAMSMHAELVRAKHDQAESFGKYLVKQGKVDDVSRSWPIQEFPADWTPTQAPAQRAVA